MPDRMLSQRTAAIIGLIVAINVIVLSFGLRSGSIFRPALLFGGFGHKYGENEQWRLDTEKEYHLGKDWDLDAPPTTRTYQFVISRGKAWPDGVVRDVLFVNGKFPGPMIRANRWDRILVNVTNSLNDEPTSIHWHGIHQKGTPWFDGTTGVTQCGIPPGQSLLYNFTLDGQFGSFWWHSHQSTQAMDGILGPLIVHAPDEAAVRETHSEDRVVLLQDWYHDPSEVNLAKYMAPGVENDEPIPDNGLINGRNFFDCTKYSSDSKRTCYKDSSRSVFNIASKSKTRLRLINAGGFASFEFSVDRHPLEVIEADSTLTQPHTLHRLPIHVGQRYSVVLNTDQAESTNYWMRASMTTSCFSGEGNHLLDSTTKAVLSYGGQDKTKSPSAEISKDWDEANAVFCEDPPEGSLVPLVKRSPPPATRFIAADFSFRTGANQMTFGQVNETVTWKPLENSTTLLEAVEGLRSSSAARAGASDGRIDIFQNDQYVMGVSHGNGSAGPDVVDLLIYSLDDGSHPFHLHGHNFWILKTGEGGFDFGHYHDAIMPSSAPELLNVIVRDTMTIKPYGWGLIRFVADNPGLWAFHCHMAWHMEAGLMMQFMSGADKLKDMRVPDEVASLCAVRPG